MHFISILLFIIAVTYNTAIAEPDNNFTIDESTEQILKNDIEAYESHAFEGYTLYDGAAKNISTNINSLPNGKGFIKMSGTGLFVSDINELYQKCFNSTNSKNNTNLKSIACNIPSSYLEESNDKNKCFSMVNDVYTSSFYRTYDLGFPGDNLITYELSNKYGPFDRYYTEALTEDNKSLMSISCHHSAFETCVQLPNILSSNSHTRFSSQMDLSNCLDRYVVLPENNYILGPFYGLFNNDTMMKELQHIKGESSNKVLNYSFLFLSKWDLDAVLSTVYKSLLNASTEDLERIYDAIVGFILINNIHQNNITLSYTLNTTNHTIEKYKLSCESTSKVHNNCNEFFGFFNTINTQFVNKKDHESPLLRVLEELMTNVVEKTPEGGCILSNDNVVFICIDKYVNAINIKSGISKSTTPINPPTSSDPTKSTKSDILKNNTNVSDITDVSTGNVSRTLIIEESGSIPTDPTPPSNDPTPPSNDPTPPNNDPNPPSDYPPTSNVESPMEVNDHIPSPSNSKAPSALVEEVPEPLSPVSETSARTSNNHDISVGFAAVTIIAAAASGIGVFIFKWRKPWKKFRNVNGFVKTRL